MQLSSHLQMRWHRSLPATTDNRILNFQMELKTYSYLDCGKVNGMWHAATTSILSWKRYSSIKTSRFNTPEHCVIIAGIVHDKCNHLQYPSWKPKQNSCVVIDTYLFHNIVKLQRGPDNFGNIFTTMITNNFFEVNEKLFCQLPMNNSSWTKECASTNPAALHSIYSGNNCKKCVLITRRPCIQGDADLRLQFLQSNDISA